MFGSLRTRVALVVIASVMLTMLVTAACIALLGGVEFQEGSLGTVISALVASTSVLLLGTLVLSTTATRSLGELVQATRELSEGRHPNEALYAVGSDRELREIAESFRLMATRLREADASERRFLMSISHELRTPLTAINGHAQALQDGLAEDVEIRDNSLAVIRREAERLDRLVEDIMDLARLRSNRFNIVIEAAYLDELGEHLMAIFRDHPARGSVDVRGDFEHILLNTDGHRVLQILRNLVNNALRYATTEVKVTGERVRGRIRITVFNDGEPIPDEMHERIFEPFVGTKREGGMGLGLAIGRELAWALGGNLQCMQTSTGALFQLTLPLEPPESR
jgi:signal transduction histidine kinase